MKICLTDHEDFYPVEFFNPKGPVEPVFTRGSSFVCIARTHTRMHVVTITRAAFHPAVSLTLMINSWCG